MWHEVINGSLDALYPLHIHVYFRTTIYIISTSGNLEYIIHSLLAEMKEALVGCSNKEKCIFVATNFEVQLLKTCTYSKILLLSFTFL